MTEPLDDLTLDDKLDKIEQLLIDTIYKKVQEGSDLNTVELQLIQRWLKSRDKPGGKPKQPKDTLIDPGTCSGTPLPFLSERLPFETLKEEVESLT